MAEPGSGDEERRPPDSEEPEEPPVGRIGARYSAIVGVLFIVFLVIVGINTLGSGEEGGILGVNETPIGDPVPKFSVPAAAGQVEGDANVAQRSCAVAERPCPPEHRQTQACEVRGSGIIRVCDFFGRPLVISFWFTRGGECEAQQDVVDRVARRYGGRVSFFSLNIRDEREAVRRLISERGWQMPVGYDADGAVSNLYRVGGCPTFAYVLPGGVLKDASIGELDERELSAEADQLLDAARERSAGARVDSGGG
jgi:hypothetical protein